MLIKFSASQTPIIKVTYNSKSCIFNSSELNVKNLKAFFNFSDLEYLEDLSGNTFYPSMEGNFAPFISSEIFVRQRLPAKVPTVIYPTETKFVTTATTWKPTLNFFGVGYYTNGKYLNRAFINFKDLSVINLKRKIDKVYLRLIGLLHENTLPTQIFAHKIETDWQGIINWSEQPVYRRMPITSSIVSISNDFQYLWDVTDLVLEWTTGLSPNNGIALRSNETVSISTYKEFYSQDLAKKPSLQVYYND